MMDFLRIHRNKIFLFTVSIFLFGTFIGFGGYFFGSSGASDSIAEVDGQEIPLRIFFSHYRRALDSMPPGQAVDKAVQQQRRDETIRDLVQSIVFTREAKRYGIHVPDKQVAISLTQVPAFQEEGKFSPRLYMQALQSQIRMMPKDFEEEQRTSIAFFKLRWLIQSAIKVTEKEAEMEAAFKQPGKPPKTADEKTKFHDQLWQEKTVYAFNLWFNQLGRDLKVKTHFELLEGQAR